MIKRLVTLCFFSGNVLFGMSGGVNELPPEIVHVILGNLLPLIGNKNNKTYFIEDVPTARKKIAVCADILRFGATSKKNNDIAQNFIEQEIGIFDSKKYASRSEWLIDSLTKKFFKDQLHADLYVAANIQGPGVGLVKRYLEQNKKAYASYELRADLLTQAFGCGVLDAGDNKWKLEDANKRKLGRHYCKKVLAIEGAYPELAQDVRAFYDHYDHSAENDDNDTIIHRDNRHKRS